MKKQKSDIMKRSLKIILSLLVLSICVSGTTIEGKTPVKKKTKRTTKTSRVSGFDTASEFINDFPGTTIYGRGTASEFCDMLAMLSFNTPSETKVRTELDDDYVYATKEVYVGGNVTVTVMSYEDYIYYMEIKFTNSSNVTKFVDRMKAYGWKYMSTFNGSKSYSNGTGTMRVKGLVVTMDYEA